MSKTIKEMIEVMKHYEIGGEVECTDVGIERWRVLDNPQWNWDAYDYRKREFQYPMWFKAKSTGLIIRFDGLTSGTVIEEGSSFNSKGEYKDIWRQHTDNEHWVQTEEPKSKEKATIEKWLIEENDIKFVVETSDIDAWLKSFPTAKKLKFIDSYEVEI